MRNLLCADFYRMFKKKPLWILAAAMAAVAAGFCLMQHTAMDYEVPLSRVIYLPMSFYGVAAAALVSIFIGTDFSDGVIRNKIISGKPRRSIYCSNLLACFAACAATYAFAALTALVIGINWFEIDVTAGETAGFFALGLFTCGAYCAIYCMISMLSGNKTEAIAICMALSFLLLFLCLETNSIVVQEQYKDGALNPRYTGGIRRAAAALLHDINPSGQAAQLSAMRLLNPARFMTADVAWVIVTTVFGVWRFNKKDIK